MILLKITSKLLDKVDVIMNFMETKKKKQVEFSKESELQAGDCKVRQNFTSPLLGSCWA